MPPVQRLAGNPSSMTPRMKAFRLVSGHRSLVPIRSVATRTPEPTHGGATTPHPEESAVQHASPFYFETGYALFAKRPSRPFPPPFASRPSGSFSDPLTTHNRSIDRRSYYEGEMIRGITNGDDAVLVEENFIAANDGVGAWATRPRGHAALWSRLVLHFWALSASETLSRDPPTEPDPVAILQRAYEQTQAATSKPNEWHGTTTICSALLHHTPLDSKKEASPLLYITNLGDSQIMVVRPSTREVLFKTTEQWHWFDCPRQLGTNSPDTPKTNAVLDKVPIKEDDVVLAMSDGVTDNLWEHEVLDKVLSSIDALKSEDENRTEGNRAIESHGGMMWVAEALVRAARVIAEDPFAESPFMERAVEEGLAMEGGKLDDISVVAAVCKRRNG